jgi:hypothetical protein
MRWVGSFVGLCVLWIVGTATAQEPVTVRLAFLPQWLINTHRMPVSPLQDLRLPPSFAETLERGVTERVVFAWQRDRIQRSSLVVKPFRVLSATEAAPFGGRGEFRMGDVEPPGKGSAWTVVHVVPIREEPDSVLVLEIGGELGTITQLIETILVEDRPGEFRERRLGPLALVENPDRVTILRVPFGQPVTVAGAAGLFRGTEGVDFLVARSLVDAVSRGDVTPNGSADVAGWTGDWREGDRVFIRASLTALRRDRMSSVLAWRDRTLRDKPDHDLDIFRPRISRVGSWMP